MSPITRRYLGWAVAAAVAAGGSTLFAQRAAQPARHVTSPKEQWGHNVGDDYFLATYQQLIAYYHKLEQQSDRVHIVEIGRTSEDRPHLMAVITSPANWAKIAHYKSLNARLAHAEGLTDEQAHALAREGKTFVWIDGGIHATEVLGAQQLIEHVYQMASRDDEETRRFLDDTVQLVVQANPDGMDLVSELYMKHSVSNPPVLYQPLRRARRQSRLLHGGAGRDDQRDARPVSRVVPADRLRPPPDGPGRHRDVRGVRSAIPTTTTSTRTRSTPSTRSAPCCRSATSWRGSTGVTQRKGAPYSTWFNGGIRTGVHFHNMIGILTETIGNPTPSEHSVRREPSDWRLEHLFPIAPQPVWHFRQSIEYEITGNRAALDFASRYRERILYDFYKMGKDEIQWGSEDHWTFTPHKVARVQAELVARGASVADGHSGRGLDVSRCRRWSRRPRRRRGRAWRRRSALYRAAGARAARSARVHHSSDQPDFGTATRFVNALIKTGVTVLRATAPFTVNGKAYPVQSYVVKTAQAFRPQVLDMFEPQDHPDDIPYPGGPPTPPYDSAGYTLAFQMGVRFDRILEGFDGPFEKIADVANVPAGQVRSPQAVTGYYFTHQSTNGVIAVNRLLAAGEDVSWLADGPFGKGTFYAAARPTTLPLLRKAATELGLTFEGTTEQPPATATKLHKLRIGLVDHYGGGMPAGWTG